MKTNQILSDRFKSVFQIDPEANAIESKGTWYPWKLLAEGTENIEQLFQQAGIKESSPIAIICRNEAGHIAALTGVISANCCAAPINPYTSPEKIISDLQDLKTPAVIATTEDWQLPGIREFAEQAGLLGLEITGDLQQPIRALTGLDKVKDTTQDYPSYPGVAILIQSSGTTGKPKRIELFAERLAEAFSKSGSVSGNADLQIKSRPAMVNQPLVHIGGCYWVISMLSDARPVLMMEKFDVSRWRDLIKEYRVPVSSLVPAALKMAFDADLPREDLESLRCIRCGTAPLSVELQKAFEERYGVPVLITFGATEFAGAVAGWTLPMHKEFIDSKIGSVGQPYEGVEMRIVDRETGEELPRGEEGLISVRSSQIGLEHGWVQTTDLAVLDEDNFLWIKGRADAAINRGGFKIIPAEVVKVLERNENILEACVVDLPDERLGQVPVAAVKLTEGAGDVSEQDVKDWIRANMPAYFVPTAVKIVEELPRTPSMKVSLTEVRAMFQ